MTEFWLAYRVGRAEAIQQSHSGGSFLIFFFDHYKTILLKTWKTIQLEKPTG